MAAGEAAARHFAAAVADSLRQWDCVRWSSLSRTVGGWQLRFGECAGMDLTPKSADSEPRSLTEAGSVSERCENTGIKEEKTKMGGRCAVGGAGEQNVS